MELITVEYFEQHFEEILEDVETNKTHYRINNGRGDVVLIPYTNFEVLIDAYKTWVNDSSLDEYEDRESDSLL